MNCSVEELKLKLDGDDDFVLLDVRTQEEYDLVHLPKSTHIPLHELEERLGELRPHQGKEILCFCHHGGRSAMAQRYLLSEDFTAAKNVPGGIHAYALRVDPSLPTYD